MSKILIVDDNVQITDILSKYAQKDGFIVMIANDGEKALDAFENFNPDIILMDVMMPKIDGFEVCRIIRRKSQVPIIMITARGEDFEKIMGLDIGADDYVVKPFAPSEVMARVRANLRRLKNNCISQNTLIINNLFISLDAYEVKINNEEINLTKKELEILWLLASNPKKVFTREQLLERIWGFDYYGESRTVDSLVKRLRFKLDEFEHSSWSIKTVWGVGYQFEVVNNVK